MHLWDFWEYFLGGGVTNSTCTNAEQQLDAGQYKTCVENCAASVGKCENLNDVFSCDRKAVGNCEINNCKSTCYPGQQLFFPLYGIGQPFISTCQNPNADIFLDCLGGCVYRNGSSPAEYCPCADSNCADIPTTCGYEDPTKWRVSYKCPV